MNSTVTEVLFYLYVIPSIILIPIIIGIIYRQGMKVTDIFAFAFALFVPVVNIVVLWNEIIILLEMNQALCKKQLIKSKAERNRGKTK